MGQSGKGGLGGGGTGDLLWHTLPDVAHSPMCAVVSGCAELWCADAPVPHLCEACTRVLQALESTVKSAPKLFFFH